MGAVMNVDMLWRDEEWVAEILVSTHLISVKSKAAKMSSLGLMGNNLIIQPIVLMSLF